MAGQNNLPRQRQIKNQVRGLLAQMTLDEKLAQLQAYWAYELQTGGMLDAEKIRTKLALGIGQITRNAGASYLSPVEAARSANQLQRFLKEQTRLGIPAIVHEECCAGAMTFGASVFPQPIGLASTWQPELAGQMTAAIAQQMRAIGAQQGLAPVLDVGRDPRWGRIEETFGEDPTLVSQFGVAYVSRLARGRFIHRRDGHRQAFRRPLLFTGRTELRASASWLARPVGCVFSAFPGSHSRCRTGFDDERLS